ncbi:MAG: arginase, partial [Flavobacteriaceae bacterium]|nr:arginase [Flavobacteriaceae bacterium]
MTSDYLSPISKKLIDFKNKLPNDSLGNKIVLYDIKKFDYNKIDIAIIGIKEYRNSVEVKSNFIDLDEFRTELYSLYYGDWNVNILDLGDLINGDNYNDT